VEGLIGLLLLIFISLLQRVCQFKTWRFSFLAEIAQLQYSMCYWCKDVGFRWESQWTTCWKIGDINDSEYIVYHQMALEICSLEGHTAEAILAATCYSAWVNNQFCKQLTQSAWDVGDVSVGADEYCTPLVIDSLKNYFASTCSLWVDGGNTKLHTELEELVAKFIGGPPCTHRQVELQGTPEQISKAGPLINEVLAEADARSSGNASCSWGFNAPQQGAKQFQMKIANNKAGLVPLNIRKRWAE
jgi:hypothetical protein